MSGFMQLILPDYTKEVPQAKCCIACLNKNVISIDLNTCKHAAIIEYLLDYKPNLKEAIVCLNCHSLIKKIEKFRVELTENMKLFEESQTNILNVNRSGLGYSNIEIYSTIDSQPIEMEIKSTNQVSPIEIMTEVKIEYDSSNSEHVPLVEIQKRKPVKKPQNIKKNKKELKNKPVKRNVSSLQKQYEGKIRIVVLSQDEMLEERQVEAKKPSYLRLPYKCDLCITAFDHELTLKSHIESRHNKSGEYECCVCKSHLSTKISFDEHYKRHFRR
nr:uncharacterized protein LOC116778373 isoform X1 [Danaus plexippus plexippus]